MAGVGDELADPGLTGVPGRQGPGDAFEHAIQRAPELSDFGVSGSRIDPDDRGGQVHFAPVEFQTGDLLRGSRNPCQGLELATNDGHARCCRGHQRNGCDYAEDDQHPQQRVVDVGGGQTGDDDLTTVVGREAHQPVATQSVQFDRPRSHIGRK